MKKKKRRLGCGLWILGTFLVIAAVVAVLYVRSKREQPTEIMVAKVERRTLTSIVSATGKVQPVVEVKISSEVAGEIIELPVEEGQAVRRGDLLARVKPDNYEASVRQREAALSASRAQSLQSRAQLLQVEQELRRLEELFDRQFVSPSELEAARTQVEVRRALFEASQFEIEQQDMGLQQARENLAKTSTLAPVDGTVSLLNSKLGERVVGTGQFAGTEIMRIADLTNMEVRIEVNENDVVNVAVGQRARVTIDAYRGRTFIGEVTHIANTARTASERSQDQVTTFEVRIRLRETDVILRPGMTAVADIETATARDVLAVLVQAVTVRDRRDLEAAAEAAGTTPATTAAATDAAAAAPAVAAEGGTATAAAERPTREGRAPREGRPDREGRGDRPSRAERQAAETPPAEATSAEAGTAVAGTADAAAPATPAADPAATATEERPSRRDRSSRRTERSADAGTSEAGSRRSRGRDRLLRVVFVRNGDRVEMREVVTGISDPTHMEIVSGLKEGDEIVTGPYTAVSRELKDGTLIKIRESTGRDAAGRTSARATGRGGPRP